MGGKQKKKKKRRKKEKGSEFGVEQCFFYFDKELKSFKDSFQAAFYRAHYK